MRAQSTFVSAVVAMVACRSAPVVPVAIDAQAIRDPIAPPVTFEPAHVDAYEVPATPVPADPAAAAVFQSMQDLSRGRGVVNRDPRLDLAATEIAGMVARGVTPSDELVAFALRAHGVVESAAAMFVLRAGEDLDARFGDKLQSNVRVGLGGAPMVAIVTFRSPVTLATTPRFARDDFTLQGTLEPRHHNATVTITREDGELERPVVATTGASFSAPFACGAHRGAQWVQIDADGALAVQLPIHCGAPPPTSFRVELDATVATSDPVRRLASIINRERVAAGLAPLIDDARVTKAARRQAEAMQHERTISHEVFGATPASRLRDAGVIPPVLFESTMKVGGIARVSELLMNDPAYQHPLDSPSATHMGIGLVTDPNGGMFVALVYVQLVAPVDPHLWADEIAGKIRASWPHARLDVALTRIAHRFADQLAVGWRESTLWPSMQLDLQSSARTSSGKVVRAVVSLDEIDVRTLIGTPDAITVADIGIGIVQSRRDGPQAGRIWVVVFYH